MAEYTYVRASDVSRRDGIGLLLLKDGEELAEVFASDEHRSMTITLWKEELPLEVIEQLITDAKDRLLPYRDDQVFSQEGIAT